MPPLPTAASRNAAIQAANNAAAAAETAKEDARRTAYTAAIAAEAECASSMNAIVNVDPYPPETP